MLGRDKGSDVLRFQIRSKDVLSPDEVELFELTQLAGVTMDPSIFKIILDLLKVNVAPMAIMQMLKLLCDPQQQRAVSDVHSFMSTSSDSLPPHHHHHQPHHRTARHRPATKTRSTLGSSSRRH